MSTVMIASVLIIFLLRLHHTILLSAPAPSFFFLCSSPKHFSYSVHSAFWVTPTMHLSTSSSLEAPDGCDCLCQLFSGGKDKPDFTLLQSVLFVFVNFELSEVTIAMEAIIHYFFFVVFLGLWLNVLEIST